MHTVLNRTDALLDLSFMLPLDLLFHSHSTYVGTEAQVLGRLTLIKRLKLRLGSYESLILPEIYRGRICS